MSETLQLHLSNICSAADRLEGVLDDTHMIHSQYFSQEFGNDIWIKPENLQKTGSFKIRGAYNKIALLSEEERAKGIVTASAGNHAQGVAYAARQFNCPCTIVMPEVTPLIKVESAREKGANVVIFGAQYDDSYAHAVQLAHETGACFAHAYNDYDVLCGQGTIVLEMLAENPKLSEIYVPVGGGGLISGVALAAKAIKPDIRIIGVEPEGAASMRASLEFGGVHVLQKCNTCAEGVAVREVGDKTFDFVRDYVDGMITVSETDIMEAVLLLLEKHKIIAEASGAIPLAALKQLNSYNKQIGCIVTGGNIDMVTISSMINSGLISRGRLFDFTVELLDTPGQLLTIAEIIARQNGNIIGLDHDQFKAKDRFNKVLLEVTVETNGHEHIREIINALTESGYNIKRIY